MKAAFWILFVFILLGALYGGGLAQYGHMLVDPL